MAGRPFHTTDTYLEDIRTMYSNEGFSTRAISAKIQEKYGVCISYSTINRRVQEWGLIRQQPNASDIIRDPQVVAFVQQEWRENCSHHEILRNISIAMPYIQITDRQLRTLREENRIKYRRRGDILLEEEEVAKEAIQEVLKEHGGAYGRDLVQVALRRDGILVSQYNLRSWQRELDPQGMLYPTCTIARLGT